MRKNCILILLAAVCCGAVFGGDSPRSDDRQSPSLTFAGPRLEIGENTVSGVSRFVFGPEATVTPVSNGQNTLVRASHSGVTHDVLFKGLSSTVDLSFGRDPVIERGTYVTASSDPDPFGDCWACQSFEDLAVSIELLGCFESCSGCTCEECVQIPCAGGPGGGGSDIFGGGMLMHLQMRSNS